MIIGLIGAPNAGKDIVADFFVKYKKFKRLAFADKIKEGFFEKTGYTDFQFKKARGTPLEKTIRDGLWEYSANICKEYGSAFFIDKVLKEIKSYNGSIVVTDVRTEFELLTLQCFGASIVLVLRNFKEELKGKILPGTKIKVNKAIEFPKFWNINDNLENTNLELERFFIELQEKRMDPDSTDN